MTFWRLEVHQPWRVSAVPIGTVLPLEKATSHPSFVAASTRIRGESVVATSMFSITYKEPVPLTQLNPSLDPRFNDLLKRALAKHPAERFRSGRDGKTFCSTGGASGRRDPKDHWGQGTGDLGFRRDRRLVSALAIGLVGKRSYRNTLDLVRDLSNRMNLEVTLPMTTDGFKFYGRVIGRVFGPACAYGQVIKTRRNDRWSRWSEEP